MRASSGLTALALRFTIATLVAAVGLGSWAGVPAKTHRAVLAPVNEAYAEQDMAALRKRWSSLTPAEQEKLRQRYAELEKKSPRERATLKQRALRLEEITARLMSTLDPVTRDRFEKLSEDKRRELLLEMVASEASERGRHILSQLPAEVQDRLEDATTPTERGSILEEFKRQRSQRLAASFRRMATEAGFTERDIDRLMTLPEDKRRPQFLTIVKRRSERMVEAHGLPAEISLERWNYLVGLEPSEFYMALTRLRRSHPMLGLPKRKAESGPVAGAMTAAQRLLRAALQPSDEERLELAGMSRPQRAREISNRRRARVLDVIKAQAMLPLEALQELDALPDDDFYQTIRELSGTGRRWGRQGTDRGRRDDGENEGPFRRFFPGGRNRGERPPGGDAVPDGSRSNGSRGGRG